MEQAAIKPEDTESFTAVWTVKAEASGSNGDAYREDGCKNIL